MDVKRWASGDARYGPSAQQSWKPDGSLDLKSCSNWEMCLTEGEVQLGCKLVSVSTSVCVFET